MEFSILESVYASNFTLNNFFDTKYARKGYFPSKRRNEHHRIQRIGIGLGTKFQLKQAVLIIWTKPARRGYY